VRAKRRVTKDKVRRTVRVNFATLLEIGPIKELNDELVAGGYSAPANAVARLNKNSWSLTIKWRGGKGRPGSWRSETWRGLPLP
jgi:hypothetical protein